MHLVFLHVHTSQLKEIILTKNYRHRKGPMVEAMRSMGRSLATKNRLIGTFVDMSVYQTYKDEDNLIMQLAIILAYEPETTKNKKKIYH